MSTFSSNSSVQAAVFSTCKALWRSSEWSQLHTLVRSLHSVRDEDKRTAKDRSWVGNAAAKLAPRAQVLAYLLVDQEHNNLRQGPFDEPVSPSLSAPLSNEERNLLLVYQHQISGFNQACLAPLIEKYPNLWPMTNPLGGYIFENPSNNVQQEILPSENLKMITQAFSKHIAFKYLELDGVEILTSLNDEFYRSQMAPIFRRLQVVSPLDAPHELNEFFITTPFNDPRRIMIRRAIALLTLRLSLLNINQVLFQALHSQKLAMFTDENLVEVNADASHLTGHGLSLTFVMEPETCNLEYGDFIGFKIPQIENSQTHFAITYWTGMTMNRDIGLFGQIILWVVDEFFNPHSSLLANF